MKHRIVFIYRDEYYKFPSPCGEVEMKQQFILIKIDCYYDVSVPLRGSGDETVKVLERVDHVRYQLFPSPCGEVEMKPHADSILQDGELIKEFPSPCGEVEMKPW